MKETTCVFQSEMSVTVYLEIVYELAKAQANKILLETALFMSSIAVSAGLPTIATIHLACSRKIHL